MLAEELSSSGAGGFARSSGTLERASGLPASRVLAYSARALRAGEADRLDEALRLRQAVFVHELSWVPGGRNGRERDRYDARALHFAVYAHPAAGMMVAPTGARSGAARLGPLVAYARVLVASGCLMLQREFAALLAGEPFVPDPRRAFEVSRFVVHPGYRGVLGADGRSAVEHLGRAIARWARATERTEWLSICELRHVRALRLRGLPFTRFGQIVEYQPGVPVCATRLDLEQATAWLRERRPVDHAWYRTEAPRP